MFKSQTKLWAERDRRRVENEEKWSKDIREFVSRAATRNDAADDRIKVCKLSSALICGMR
jgi:hypothetical protein